MRYPDCEECKAVKHYPSAQEALDHLHTKHIDCLHNEYERPYDDPCYVWLHRIWHSAYPIRRSPDLLQGNMEDFIDELSDINSYIKELHNMMVGDSSTNDATSAPSLPANIIHIFRQIVKIFVFRSKQLSLINRQQSLADGSLPGNIRLIQRIDEKIEELSSQEADTQERIIDLLESAKKDIFLSGIGSHTEMPLQAETVRGQFLALAFMSEISQRSLLQPRLLTRSHAQDTLLQLYKDYTSRLHFQANRRPRKKVFLDIHGVEEELQGLDKLFHSQETCLYNFMALVDPLTSRYTTEVRLREFQVELQYGNSQLRDLINKRREIDNLATRLRFLKDQVKQTIEILEEDHGKAIRVFTVVTLFFLPLSFVSSFLGMNTVDVRNSDANQGIFWMTGVPITVAVLALAFIYGYKGDEIHDWMIHESLHQRRQRLSSAFQEIDKSIAHEAPFEIQSLARRRSLRGFVRNRVRSVSSWRPFAGEMPEKEEKMDMRASVKRRDTDDSLAPIRYS